MEAPSAPPTSSDSLDPALPAASSTPQSARARKIPTAATARTEATAVATAPGYLNLIATPAAEVAEGGTVIGTTPLVKRPLPAGVHRLRVRTLDGRATSTVVVTTQPGETTASVVKWP